MEFIYYKLNDIIENKLKERKNIYLSAMFQSSTKKVRIRILNTGTAYNKCYYRSKRILCGIRKYFYCLR
jgi:hypothetical protein